jgi:hypothetical protein
MWPTGCGKNSWTAERACNRSSDAASWRYRIDGRSVDGAPLACVVVVERDTVVLITAYFIREESP